MKQPTSPSRHHRNPHSHENNNKPFFTKTNTAKVQTKAEDTFFQTKLTIGQPGDKYEQEADAMADAVVNQSATAPGVQQKKISSIQRYMTNAEFDERGTNTERIEEDKRIQEKPEVQRMENEEEETLQTKSTSSENVASPSLSNKINSTKGSGQQLSGKVRQEMESSFGNDFSGVRVHTNHNAVEMNKGLGAQAFTHGQDVYFNAGKYAPESKEGKGLLAHELTHVVQQGGGNKTESIQRYGGCTSTQDAMITGDHTRALGMLDVAIRKLGTYNGSTPTKVFNSLNTHFSGSTSSAFGSWIKFNLQFLRLVAPLAGYQCETVGGSYWACTNSNTLATTFWCVPFVDIRICPSYFSQSNIDRSTTLIHEWVHKYGCNFDLGYEHEAEYSGNYTITQLLNADSFANFVKDVQ